MEAQQPENIMSNFCRDFPVHTEHLLGYAGAHPNLVGKYLVSFEHYGRFVGASLYVVDDFGDLILVE